VKQDAVVVQPSGAALSAAQGKQCGAPTKKKARQRRKAAATPGKMHGKTNGPPPVRGRRDAVIEEGSLAPQTPLGMTKKERVGGGKTL